MSAIADFTPRMSDFRYWVFECPITEILLTFECPINKFPANFIFLLQENYCHMQNQVLHWCIHWEYIWFNTPYPTISLERHKMMFCVLIWSLGRHSYCQPMEHKRAKPVRCDTSCICYYRFYAFSYISGPPLSIWFNINPSKVWDKISSPFLNFNGCTAEV